MKRFLLTFKQKELEQQYQRGQLTQIKKPVYIFIMISCLLLNLGAVANHFLHTPLNTWYLNLIFSICCMIQIVVLLIMKRMEYFQLALTFTNIVIGFLELDVDAESTSKTEFFAYGNVFMQLQAVLYIISDFPHVVIQIISHAATRSVITTIISQHVDYLAIASGIVSAFLILITIYVVDRNSRRLYLQNLKENYFVSIISFLVSQPYFIVSYDQNQLIFNLTKHYQVERFPGYNNEYCEGCNCRKLLRNYYQDTKTPINLERLILKKRLQLPGVFQIIFNKQKYQVKICSTDIQSNSFMIILNRQQENQALKQDIKVQEAKLTKFMQQKQKQINQVSFRWGVLSVILLPNKEQRKINLASLVKKLVRIYAKQIYNDIQIQINEKTAQNVFVSYIHQLKILLIQIFDIFVKIQRQDRSMILLSFHSNSKNVYLTINIKKSKVFVDLLNSNYFVQQLFELLIERNTLVNSAVSISFKNYSKDSYYPN